MFSCTDYVTAIFVLQDWNSSGCPVLYNYLSQENILRWKTEIDVKFCLNWSVRFIDSVFHETSLYPTVFRRFLVLCGNTSLKKEQLVFSYLYWWINNTGFVASYSKQTVKCSCNSTAWASRLVSYRNLLFKTVLYDYSILLASCQASMYAMLFWSLWLCLDLAYLFL